MLRPAYGWVAFEFFSHKVLRTLAPVFMVSLLVSSALLAGRPEGLLALAVQVVLYGLALAGYVCQRSGRMVRWLSPPLYFCLGNLAMLAGLLKYCFNREHLAWERVR
jgi:hypothetical protein